ncbi:phosphotransferase [Mycolicibacterium sp. XJ662]
MFGEGRWWRAAGLLTPVQMVADRVLPTASVPRTPDQVSAEWLEGAVGLPAGSIAKMAIRDVDHGTSLRVQVEIGGSWGNQSLFIKHTPVRVPARIFNLVAGLSRNEVAFYRHLGGEICCAPDALVASFDPLTGRSIIVLPDLRDDGFVFPTMTTGCDADQAASAIEALADLHSKYGHPGNVSGQLRPSAIHHVVTPLLCRYVGRNPRPLAHLVPDDLAAQLPLLAQRPGDTARLLNGVGQTLIHNDTHVGNMAFLRDRAILVDWQLCASGVGLKDVAYFLATSVSPDLRRSHERDLLTVYLDAMEAGGGHPPSWDEAWRAYRILAIAGYLAAAATALSGDRLQDPANARTGMQRAVAALRDLESLRALKHALEDAKQ